MNKSTITRERLQEIVSDPMINQGGEFAMMARMALAAMDSEPVAWTDEQELRDVNRGGCGYLFTVNPVTPHADERRIILLYRHAQPVPVVPHDVLEALQKVARIRLDLNDFDGDRRGIADCLGDAEEALIEVVNRRAAMLAAAQQLPGSEPATAPGKWIPVSERMPENKPGSYEYLVFEKLNNRVNHDYWNCPDAGDDTFTPFWNHYGEYVTHWMPLPAAPQEVKGE